MSLEIGSDPEPVIPAGMRKHPLAKCEESDYAYLAGLLDGEGWFGSAKQTGGGHAPRIQIGMTNQEVLIWCQSHFGGSIHTMAHVAANRRASWKWNMSSNHIRLHLPYVIPFLKVKHRQAALVLDWLDNWSNIAGQKSTEQLRAKQEELWISLKALNQSTH